MKLTRHTLVLIVVYLLVSVESLFPTLKGNYTNNSAYDPDSINQNENILRLFVKLASDTARHLIYLKKRANIVESSVKKPSNELSTISNIEKMVNEGVRARSVNNVGNEKNNNAIINKGGKSNDTREGVNIANRFFNLDGDILRTVNVFDKLGNENKISKETNEKENLNKNKNKSDNSNNQQSTKEKSIDQIIPSSSTFSKLFDIKSPINPVNVVEKIDPSGALKLLQPGPSGLSYTTLNNVLKNNSLPSNVINPSELSNIVKKNIETISKQSNLTSLTNVMPSVINVSKVIQQQQKSILGNSSLPLFRSLPILENIESGPLANMSKKNSSSNHGRLSNETSKIEATKLPNFLQMDDNTNLDIRKVIHDVFTALHPAENPSKRTHENKID